LFPSKFAGGERCRVIGENAEKAATGEKEAYYIQMYKGEKSGLKLSSNV